MTRLGWLRNHVPAEARPALGAIHRVLDQHLTSDGRFIEGEYTRTFGKPPDVADPQTFNEKTQWRKLYRRQPRYRTMTDMMAVRDYVASRVGEHYLAPLLGIYDRADDVPWAEWAHKDAAGHILVERFIGSGRQPFDDFKFFCFDSVPRVAFRLVDRYGSETHTWYDSAWTSLPFHGRRPAAVPSPAPPALPEMLDIARGLSEGMDFVRVDLCHVDGRVCCGELTLYPCGGFEAFSTPEADEWLGAFWHLPASGGLVDAARASARKR